MSNGLTFSEARKLAASANAILDNYPVRMKKVARISFFLGLSIGGVLTSGVWVLIEALR